MKDLTPRMKKATARGSCCRSEPAVWSVGCVWWGMTPASVGEVRSRGRRRRRWMMQRWQQRALLGWTDGDRKKGVPGKKGEGQNNN